LVEAELIENEVGGVASCGCWVRGKADDSGAIAEGNFELVKFCTGYWVGKFSGVEVVGGVCGLDGIEVEFSFGDDFTSLSFAGGKKDPIGTVVDSVNNGFKGGDEGFPTLSAHDSDFKAAWVLDPSLLVLSKLN